MKYLWLSLLLLTAACKKEGTDPATEPDDADSTLVPYYKLQRVENLNAATDDDNPTVAKTEILYSLRYKKEQPASYAKTNRWDISFSGLYNSFLGGNNNSNAANTGYQGPGIGGVTIVQKAFDAVTDIPAATAFNTGKGIIGTDDLGAFGQGTGWYLYDFDGTKIGDGSDQKQHVAYAMGDSLPLSTGGKINPRTIIVKLGNGDFAKIKMISCYKNLFTYNVWLKDSPHMYFTFEYVIVPASATKFEIK